MNSAKSGHLARTSNRRFVLLFCLAVLLPVAMVAVLALLFPREVWDDFLYRYFWGPVVSDSEEHSINGIKEGYNPISTLTYGLLLALAFYATYLIARQFKLRIDAQLIFASVPMVLFGGAARALEDAQLYRGWLSYLFISPLIYFVVAAFFFSAVALGLLMEWKGERLSLNHRTALFSAAMAAILALYFSMAALGPGLSATLSPVLPVVLAAASILAFRYALARGVAATAAAVLGVGLLLLGLAASYLLLFTVDPSWQAIYVQAAGKAIAPHYAEMLIIPAIALLLTSAVLLLGRALKGHSLAAIAAPLSLLLFLSQFLDGAATYRGIEIYGYMEKHVLPTFLIDWAGSAIVMFPIKFLAVLLIVVILDVLFKKDLDRYPNLSNIVKFGVVFLGLAPGMRDTIRIALGV